MKRQALFVRSSPQFRKTDWIGDTLNDSVTGIPGVVLNGTETFATYLRNPDSGTGFLIARQTNSSSVNSTSFRVTVPSAHGALDLPQSFDAITLDGRQSKVIITDYTFGTSGSVLHTTATVFFTGTVGDRDVLFLTGDLGQSHEVSLVLAGRGGKRASSAHVTYVPSRAAREATTVTFHAGFAKGLITVWDSDKQLVLFADLVTAATFWAPPIRDETANTVKGLETYWQFGTNTTVLVGGPYLVRNATIVGSTLALRGDLNASVLLSVVGPASVTTVTWNGARVQMNSDGRGVLTGQLKQGSVVKAVEIPKLSGWKYADSFPEIQTDFDDSYGVIADHTSTNITQGMLFGDGRVLYGMSEVIVRAVAASDQIFSGCDYG